MFCIRGSWIAELERNRDPGTIPCVLRKRKGRGGGGKGGGKGGGVGEESGMGKSRSKYPDLMSLGGLFNLFETQFGSEKW